MCVNIPFVQPQSRVAAGAMKLTNRYLEQEPSMASMCKTSCAIRSGDLLSPQRGQDWVGGTGQCRNVQLADCL